MPSVNIEVPQELSDIKDLLVGVARDLKAGKKPMEVVFGSLKSLEAACSNLSQIPVELKSPGVYRVVALLIADMLEIFLPPSAELELAGVVDPLADAVNAAAGELDQPAPQAQASTQVEASPLV